MPFLVWNNKVKTMQFNDILIFIYTSQKQLVHFKLIKRMTVDSPWRKVTIIVFFTISITAAHDYDNTIQNITSYFCARNAIFCFNIRHATNTAWAKWKWLLMWCEETKSKGKSWNLKKITSKMPLVTLFTL